MTRHLPKSWWNCKPNPKLLQTSLDGFSPLSIFSSGPLPPPPLHSRCFIQFWSLCNLHVAPAILIQLFSFPYFAIFLQDHCDIAFNPTSIFDRFKPYLIVNSQYLVGIFMHSLNMLLAYFLWRLVATRIQLHYLLPSLLARIHVSWGDIQVLSPWGKVILILYLLIIVIKHLEKSGVKLLYWSVAVVLASTYSRGILKLEILLTYWTEKMRVHGGWVLGRV